MSQVTLLWTARCQPGESTIQNSKFWEEMRALLQANKCMELSSMVNIAMDRNQIAKTKQLLAESVAGEWQNFFWCITSCKKKSLRFPISAPKWYISLCLLLLCFATFSLLFLPRAAPKSFWRMFGASWMENMQVRTSNVEGVMKFQWKLNLKKGHEPPVLMKLFNVQSTCHVQFLCKDGEIHQIAQHWQFSVFAYSVELLASAWLRLSLNLLSTLGHKLR